MKNDFKSLKVGDRVTIQRNLSPNTYATIERLTKTQIIIANSDSKYKRKTGCLVGKFAWGFDSWLVPESTEEIAKIKSTRGKRKCVSFLTDFKWDKFDLEFLREMIALLNLKQIVFLQPCGRKNNNS